MISLKERPMGARKNSRNLKILWEFMAIPAIFFVKTFRKVRKNEENQNCTSSRFLGVKQILG
jgi:hypothetical protein